MTITQLTRSQKTKLNKEKKLHAARERRLQFKGMTESEILEATPIALAEFVENKQTGGISLVVPSCPICGERHNHGYGDLKGGYRVPHCTNETREVIPYNYELVIDWRKGENIRLREVLVKRIEHRERKQSGKP